MLRKRSQTAISRSDRFTGENRRIAGLTPLTIFATWGCSVSFELVRLRNPAAEQRSELSPRRVCEPWVDSHGNFGAAERRLNSCMICALRLDWFQSLLRSSGQIFVLNPTLAKPRVGLN